MKVTLLGTGTSQGIPVIGCQCETCASSDPRDKRLRCSALVQTDTTTVVIDVGPDFRQQMLSQDVRDIDAVFITHEHNDHLIGLDDLRPFIFRRREPMAIYAEPRVIDEIQTRFSYAFGPKPYPGAPSFDLRPIHPGDTIDVGDVTMQAMRVEHGRLPILSFRIDEMVYMTDVSAIPDDTMEQLDDVSLLILDALRHEPHHSHFSLSEAIDAARDIDADRTYLIHMSHLMGRTSVWEQTLPPKIYPAYDGLQFDL